MATVREKLLPVTARLRGIADTKMGLRRFRVFLRRRSPSDGRGGRGASETVVDVELVEKPRVREASGNDIASSGGKIAIGDYILDRITPRNDANTVGTAPGTIPRSPALDNQQVLVVLVGPGMPAYVEGPPPSGGGEFTVASTDETKNFGFSYVLRPRTGAGPR
jgi:hypothetical protein